MLEPSPGLGERDPKPAPLVKAERGFDTSSRHPNCSLVKDRQPDVPAGPPTESVSVLRSRRGIVASQLRPSRGCLEYFSGSVPEAPVPHAPAGRPCHWAWEDEYTHPFPICQTTARQRSSAYRRSHSEAASRSPYAGPAGRFARAGKTRAAGRPQGGQLAVNGPPRLYALL